MLTQLIASHTVPSDDLFFPSTAIRSLALGADHWLFPKQDFRSWEPQVFPEEIWGNLSPRALSLLSPPGRWVCFPSSHPFQCSLFPSPMPWGVASQKLFLKINGNKANLTKTPETCKIGIPWASITACLLSLEPCASPNLHPPDLPPKASQHLPSIHLLLPQLILVMETLEPDHNSAKVQTNMVGSTSVTLFLPYEGQSHAIM